MAEDVLAISRGHLDRRIEGKGAVGELAHLAKAVDRMVGDLLEGKETEEPKMSSRSFSSSTVAWVSSDIVFGVGWVGLRMEGRA